jgi:aminodeoxyfutalosine deaminase
MPPATLLALAARRGVALPADDEAGLRRWFRFRDFDHFVEVYVTCSSCLAEPEDFQRLAVEFLAEQGRQNVVYSEVHFTISTHLARGGDGEAIAEALAAGAAEGERRFGARLRLIPDVVRNMPRERADRTVEWALAGVARGLTVALGIGGVEAGHPPEPFAAHFAAAARGGLRRVAHAGEHAGPDSVRAALEVLGAERIGHGVRAAEDPALVADLARRGVPLEVCPSSNLCLGVFPDLASHPFDRLHRAGVRVSVNSDDPPLFATTLCDEYLRLAATFGYGPRELAGFALAGLAHSFLPAAEKAALEADFRRRIAGLGEELFGAPVTPA